MFGLLVQGILETKINFIAAAAGVCALTAMTLVLLTRNAAMAAPAQRLYAAIWVALVAGVGVWTTHFVAMIGYRPDAALTYSLGLTLMSIFVGVIGVGLPLAASLFFHDRPLRIALGVLAGIGVAAMHLTGMSAIENCLATYNPIVLLVGVSLGIAGFVWTMSQDPNDEACHVYRCLGMIGGVCSLHFVAMASVEIELLVRTHNGIGGSTLSIMVAIISLLVFVTSMLMTFNHRRSLAMRRAGF